MDDFAYCSYETKCFLALLFLCKSLLGEHWLEKSILITYLASFQRLFVMGRWRIDLNRSKAQGTVAKVDVPAPNSLDLSFNLEVDEASMTMSTEMQLAAKQRQVTALSYSPGKSLFTTAFMLWMSGNSIQIFSIMMTGMALINPLKAIASVNQTFKPFEKEEGINLYIPKLIFIALQVLSLGVAVYKCSTMGLLPLTSSDWVSYLPVKPYMEHAGIPL